MTVQEAIAARRAALLDRLGPLRVELAVVECELRQLHAAEEAIRGNATPRNGDTIKEHAVRLIGAQPQGMYVGDLLNAMRITRPDLTRESLAPQLSRLGRDGRLIREGRGVWRTTSTTAPAPDGRRGD